MTDRSSGAWKHAPKPAATIWLATSGPYWVIIGAAVAVAASALVAIT